jgi:hypothetical protein
MTQVDQAGSDESPVMTAQTRWKIGLGTLVSLAVVHADAFAEPRRSTSNVR